MNWTDLIQPINQIPIYDVRKTRYTTAPAPSSWQSSSLHESILSPVNENCNWPSNWTTLPPLNSPKCSSNTVDLPVRDRDNPEPEFVNEVTADVNMPTVDEIEPPSDDEPDFELEEDQVEEIANPVIALMIQPPAPAPADQPCALFRGGYNNYCAKSKRARLQTIFGHLENNTKTLGEIHKESKIARGTLDSWATRMARTPDWRPWHNNRAGTNAIFTYEEEGELAAEILEIIDQALIFSNEDFRTMATDKFANLQIERGAFRNFNCSDGYITAFKKRWHFSSLRAHPKRRTATVTAQTRDNFIVRVRDLLRLFPRLRIINMDETAWLLYPTGILTWARKGADGVTFDIKGNAKARLTVLASVDASGNKMPLFFVAQGKTTRVETSQIGDIGNIHKKTHSESGWCTEAVMIEYLELLRSWFPPTQPLQLVLDCYRTHIMDSVKQRAIQLSINLVFVPPGLTDALQPLDRRVFGCLKATARRLFRLRDIDQRTLPYAALDMLTAWDNLDEHVVLSGWSIYEEEEDEDE